MKATISKYFILFNLPIAQNTFNFIDDENNAQRVK